MRPANPNLPRWISLYERGATVTRIADGYGLTPSAVSQALRKAGVPMRPQGAQAGRKPITSAWHADAIAAQERGETYESIAARVFRSPEAVRSAVWRHRRQQARV